LPDGAKVLFIDGDNTIRRRPDGHTPEGALALDAALQSCDLSNLFIVASGQWKDVLPLEGIRELFSKDVAARVVDITPALAPAEGMFGPHLEIHAWLAAHPEIKDYCVVEPSWPLEEPMIESALFIQDGLVFGERDTDARYLRAFINSDTSWKLDGLEGLTELV